MYFERYRPCLRTGVVGKVRGGLDGAGQAEGSVSRIREGRVYPVLPCGNDEGVEPLTHTVRDVHLPTLACQRVLSTMRCSDRYLCRTRGMHGTRGKE